MNKLYILIFCFFSFLTLNAQYKSGEILYTLKRNDIGTSEIKVTDIRLKELRDKIHEATTKLEFILNFNSNHSTFKLVKSLSLDFDDYFTRMGILATRGDRLFYCSLNDSIILEQTSFSNRDFIIKSEIKDLEWKLTKETKKIGDYQCYKGVATIHKKNHLNEDVEYNYIAWYSPEIPFNLGPYQIVGLPGLVLEFTDNTKTFTASKIKLYKKDTVIEPPSIGEVVTHEEFEKITKEAYESAKN